MGNRIVWFDIPVSDLGRAAAFYKKVLKTEVDESSQAQGMVVFNHGDGDVSGCLTKHEGFKPSKDGPLLYFTVQGRLDEALSLVESSGGKILQAKHAIGPYGMRGIVLDNEGNRIALHSES